MHAEPAGSPREEGGSQLVVCVGVMLLTCVRVGVDGRVDLAGGGHPPSGEPRRPGGLKADWLIRGRRRLENVLLLTGGSSGAVRLGPNEWTRIEPRTDHSTLAGSPNS